MQVLATISIVLVWLIFIFLPFGEYDGPTALIVMLASVGLMMCGIAYVWS